MRVNAPWLAAGAALLAVIAAVPTLAVVTRGIAPGAGATWEHLLATVLPEMLGNTLLLMLLVGLGVIVGGTACGWLVARHRFPGSRVFEWALLLPLAMPAYVMAYAYTDFLQYAGPVQTALRNAFGLAHGDYWFPDIRTLPGAAMLFTFSLFPYVYLLTRVAFLERSRSLVGGGAHPGPQSADGVLARGPAARAAGDRRRRRAGAHGDARGLRHRVVLRRADVHHRHLSRVVQPGRPRGRRAARERAAGLRGDGARARAREPRRGTHARRRARPRRGRCLARAVARDGGGVRHRDLRDRGDGGLRAAGADPAAPHPQRCRRRVRSALLHVDGQYAHRGRRRGADLRGARHRRGVCAASESRHADAAREPRAHAGLRGAGHGAGGRGAAAARRDRCRLRRLASRGHGRAARPAPHRHDRGAVYAYCLRYFAVAWNAVEPGFARITPAMDAAARSLGTGAAGTLARVHAPLLCAAWPPRCC